MRTTDSGFRTSLEIALKAALAHLENLDSRPVSASAGLDSLRKRLFKDLQEVSLSPEDVLVELVSDVEGSIVGSAGGRFFGWVIGGSLPSALAADWLTAAWDQNAALYACSPAAAVVEEAAGMWLKQVLGLPEHASFAFVTGCQMAHVTSLISARHALLAERGWDVERQGLFGAQPVRILSSDQHHGSFERAVRIVGLGTSQLIGLPTDSLGRLSPGALEGALGEAPDVPTIVLLQAGEINIGAFDEFETLIPIAKRYGAWVHIDGAFGLWAAASPSYRRLVKGVELADSWATDGHKWLNVPFDSGYAFVADREAHRAAISPSYAAYLTHDADARDQIDWNPDWSRRARGFSTYAALRQLGRDGISELVDRCCCHARTLVNGIGALSGTQVLWEPVINQGLVRFLHPGPKASDMDHDRRTDEVIAAIVAEGEAFFGGTTWRGRRAMRVSICNWQTSQDDVDRAIRSIAGVLDRLARN